MNRLSHADASTFLSQYSGSIDLCYMDPPFNLGVSFTARTGPTERRTRNRRDVGPVAYDDRWPSVEAFIEFLQGVFTPLREAMSPHGVVWIHLDHRAVHEAKVAADRIFGRGAFRGEVIWVPGNGARSKKGPSCTHQTLLVYAARPKSELVWNSDHPLLRESFAATSLKMHFQSVDADGRQYRDRAINGKTYRYYADEGRKLGSVWTDLPAMSANTPIRSEGTGYPTQKPEKLLERIILLSSKPGALVCDPMCGSGTTLVVAAKLDRSFVGCDIGELAIEITSKRLHTAGIPFDADPPCTRPADGAHTSR
ncbi:MAG: site-specific DNA-methyltransferase [Deltaproteobacteria bacterium]|nr:site-specific DNA-methyltransferase [Deltaproteobacteria bacterium]